MSTGFVAGIAFSSYERGPFSKYLNNVRYKQMTKVWMLVLLTLRTGIVQRYMVKKNLLKSQTFIYYRISCGIPLKLIMITDT